MMLTDPEEIRIIANARQKNVRDPKRPREHFTRIFSDFLGNVNSRDAVFLDLGPGQYDFGVLAKERGALTYGIDNDEAVVELGNYKGFPVIHGNIRNIKHEDFDRTFDGVFCKYSINAFWFHDDSELHRRHIEEIAGLVKPGGWAWIAAWNGIPKSVELTKDDIRRVLSVQTATFRRLGFEGIDLSDHLCRYYGVHGDTANKALFTLNLEIPKSVMKCRKL